MQPYLFPYIGYFQLISTVDKFVFYDDVAFIKQGWNDQLKSFFLELRKLQRDPKFVFVDPNGDPYSPDHFNQRHFKGACERAGVRELRFYDIRHTFASHFMMKGGNLFELQKLLGHANIEETMIYAHLSPEHLEKASQIVNFGITFGNEKADGPFLALAE